MGLRVDAGTAALLTAIASFSAAYWLLSLRLAHRTIKGVNKGWAISLMLQGCGWTLIALRPNFKAEYTAIPGTLFVLLAAVLQLRVFGSLRNRHLDLRPTYFLYAVTSAVHMYFGYLNQNGPARVVATSVFAALVSGQTIWVLYRGEEPVRRGLIRLLIGLYAFMLLILAARGVFFYLRLSEPGMDVYGGALGNQVGYAAFFLTAFLPSLGFFSLCNDLFDQRQQLYDGEISKITGELTERYRIEEQLLLGLAGFVYRCRNDADWTIIYMSRGAREITGFPENDFVESAVRSFGSIMHTDDVDWVWQKCQAGIAAHKNCSNEYRIITAAGETRWIWDQAHGIYAEDGTLQYIEGLVTDITERKNQDMRVKDLNILYRLISDCNRAITRSMNRQDLFEGIVAACTANGILKLAWFSLKSKGEGSISMAAAAGDAVGYLKADVISRAGTQDAASEELLHFGMQSAVTFRILHDPDAEISLHLYSAEKNFFNAERRALFNQITSDILQALDKIEAEEWRMAAEHRLLENSRLLDFALESTIDAVWDFDCIRGKAVFSRNWEQMLGFEPEQLENSQQAWESRVHTDDLFALNQNFKGYLEGRLPIFDVEYRVRAKNGEYVWIKDRGIAVSYDLQGKALRFVGTLKNIDAEIRRKEDAARNSELLEAIFDNVPVGISVSTAGQQVLRLNRMLTEITGIPDGVDIHHWRTKVRYYREDGTQYPQGKLPDILTVDGASVPAKAIFGRQNPDDAEPRWLSVQAVYLSKQGVVVRISSDITEERNRQRQLEESETKFRTLFDALPVGVMVFNAEGKAIETNRLLQETTRLSETEFVEGKWRDRTYCDESGNIIPVDRLPVPGAIREKRSLKNVVLGRVGENDTIWFRVDVEPVPELDIFICITVDISEARRGEQALRASETKFRTLFQELPVGVSLHNLQREVLDSNQTAMQCLGMTLGQMRAGDTLRINYFDEDGNPLSVLNLPGITALREKRNISRQILGFDRGNERRWVEMSIALMTDLEMYAVITHDITEERNRQRQLKDSETKFHGLFELMPAGLAIISRERSVIEFNERLREISGMDDGELKSAESRERTYWRPGGVPIADADLPIARGIRDGNPVYDEVFGIKTGDKMRWVSASVAPIEELDIYIGILSEITEIVEAREALKKANEHLEVRVAERTHELTKVNAELEAFSYSLSHDMKAPLTRIESWANVLLEEYRGALGEEGQKIILFLRHEIAGMHSMIRAMLSLARASTLDMAPVLIDLPALAEIEFALLRDNFPDLKVQFTVEPGLTVWADLTLFTVLLRNLLENALKFSSKLEQAQITLGMLQGEQPEVTYYLRDNGDGFDMRYADRLFAPFQRMHTQKEFPGTGIGLATAQRIVHRHGGRIWVESSKGGGTTFFFTLPRAKNLNNGAH